MMREEVETSNKNKCLKKGNTITMKDGFIKVATATPEIRIADCEYNADQIIKLIKEGKEKRVKIMVFPELCITGYTCGDLFLHETLLESAKEQLQNILESTKGSDMLLAIGMPMEYGQKLYNCAVWLQNGSILGVVPKKHIPNYHEFYEGRYFVNGQDQVVFMKLLGQNVPFGSKLLFACDEIKELIVGCEICEDLWVPMPPSIGHAMAGATVIANLSASDEITSKEVYRRNLVNGQAGRLCCAYLYTSAGEGESTSDVVYSGDHIISENGTELARSKRFTTGITVADIDVKKLCAERRRMMTFKTEQEGYVVQTFHFVIEEVDLIRQFPKTPFIPSNVSEREKRCEEIFMIQAQGLKKRLAHTKCNHAIVGISGGLDSTLALLVMAKAFDLLGMPREQIISITMPCYGTTDRTYQNAVQLTKQLGATLKEIRINKAVDQHFEDIGHDPNNHNVVYENAQARERTQVLMDVANAYNGMVIGTGDMSELALGWATYNGDHMSMYGVNCSVPKTLVRHLVQYYADVVADPQTREILIDILDTPVSPELLPPVDGVISQKTEDLVGPYELHDFFLYYMLRFGYEPKKIFRIACRTFEGIYEQEDIYKWLRTFYWRFFSQQFKRNCLPDGPKVGTVSLSPRGDLRMPSDASSALWMKQMDEIKEKFGL